MCIRWVLAALVLISPPAFAGGISGGHVGLTRPHVNFMLVTVDDLGREWWREYNPSAPDDLPELDALASSGVVLTGLYVSPVCGATREALQSGRYWTRRGAGGHLATTFAIATEVSIPAMLELSWPGLYHRAHFGKRGIGADAYAMGQIGFEFSVDGTGTTGLAWTAGTVTATSRDPADMTLGTTSGTAGADAGMVAEFTSWAASEGIFTDGRPWLVEVDFIDPHAPIIDPATGDPCPPNDPDTCFVAMRQQMDTNLGALLDAIPADEMAHTLVVVMSDNGTAIQIAGAALPGWGYCGGKGSSCEDGLGAIAVIGGGVVTNPGRTDTAKRGLVDVMATVLDYAHAMARPQALPIVPGKAQYQGQPYKSDGLSWRSAISEDCPAGTACDALHIVTFGNPTSSSYPSDPSVWVGITQDGYKLFNYALGEEYMYLITSPVAAEDVDTPDICAGGGDCSNLTGTPLARYNQIKAAYAALLVDSE